MYQIWWSELVEPEFTDEQKETYLELCVPQFYPIGNTVAGRRLFRAVVSREKIDIIMEFVSSAGKKPKICDIRDVNGVRYGEQQVFTVDDEGNETYKIVDIPDMTKYSIDNAERDLYFDKVSVDIEGVTVMIEPTDNTAAGWASWKERL